MQTLASLRALMGAFRPPETPRHAPRCAAARRRRGQGARPPTPRRPRRPAIDR